MSAQVRFDQIVYFTADPQGDFPVRRRCPTWYERDQDGRPAHPAEFQADDEFLERVTPWLGDVVVGDMTAGPDPWRQWLHEVARRALKGEAYRAFEPDGAR